MSVVLMKEATSTEFAYDIALVPPFSFRNALPCGISFRRQGDSANVLVQVGKEEPIYGASSELPVTLELRLPTFGRSIFVFDPALLV